MKLSRLLIILPLIVLLPSLHASPQKHKKKTTTTEAAKTAKSTKSDTVAAGQVTLKDGRPVRIENGRLMVTKPNGNYVAAPAGTYTTKDGKTLLVGNDGWLTKSGGTKMDPPRQPEVKKTREFGTNGTYHQTGSNL